MLCRTPSRPCPPHPSRESGIVNQLLNRRYGALYPSSLVTYRKETDDSLSKVWLLSSDVALTPRDGGALQTAARQDEHAVGGDGQGVRQRGDVDLHHPLAQLWCDRAGPPGAGVGGGKRGGALAQRAGGGHLARARAAAGAELARAELHAQRVERAGRGGAGRGGARPRVAAGRGRGGRLRRAARGAKGRGRVVARPRARGPSRGRRRRAARARARSQGR